MQPQSIADLFRRWEKKQTYEWAYTVDSRTYKERDLGFFKGSIPEISAPVHYPLDNEEVFVISDLHIGSGRTASGVYKGSENFFADEAFSRFIHHISEVMKTPTGVLVINGDLFDFLRVTEFPGKVRKLSTSMKIRNFLKGAKNPVFAKPSAEVVTSEIDLWSNELKAVGMEYNRDALRNSILPKEKAYGLETEAFKTIYKLMVIKRGHPLFFETLAKWLMKGNRLLITKGNHDLEIYWPEVRNYIRLQLATDIAALTGQDIESILEQEIFPRIKFIDDSVVIGKDFYVEHGHRYDKFTMVLDSPELKDKPSQINIPFGSFFNRYVINRVELYYPFLDKVRPAGNVLPMLIRENFPLALKIIFEQIPFALRMLVTNRRYIGFMLNRVLWFLLAILVPVAVIIVSNWNWLIAIIANQNKSSRNTFGSQLALQSIKGAIALCWSYLLSRVIGWFQLAEPDSLSKYAADRNRTGRFRVLSMGHTHNPGEYLFTDGSRFYNTGTWIPVIETSDASVRNGFSYTFLHLPFDGSATLLQRWNDEANRAEPQLLLERK